jgi:hypothetical protein
LDLAAPVDEAETEPIFDVTVKNGDLGAGSSLG